MSGADTPPVVILVAPQMGENIGMAARAMANVGWTQLRLVDPRDGWPNPRALALAAGAPQIINQARIFANCSAAIADLGLVFATSARPRHLPKPMFSPQTAATRLHTATQEGIPSGLLFGGERSGLSNEDLALTDGVITVDLAFSSLNLAQAVLLIGYAWRLGAGTSVPPLTPRRVHTPAPRGELLELLRRLEALLHQGGFFFPPEKAPRMRRNIRSLCVRAAPSSAELRTLHGIISTLLTARKRR